MATARKITKFVLLDRNGDEVEIDVTNATMSVSTDDQEAKATHRRIMDTIGPISFQVLIGGQVVRKSAYIYAAWDYHLRRGVSLN